LWATRPVVSQEPVAGAELVAPMIWAHAPFTYTGAQSRFDRAVLGPGPVQAPRVPVLIGGSGERVTFRLVARYADMANVEDTKAPTPEAVRAKLDALRRRCDDVRRPFETLLPSYFVNGVVLAPTPARLQAKLSALRFGSPNVGTPDELAARLRPFVAAGVRYLIANLAAYDDLETAELLAEQVVPALQTA
jgi:alkanesulfonate monooxygenase SsuD/methylene tetrahydromethanopterin reductase-like flavin-dependent oxidoreductase (luciferase family)